MSYQVHFYFCLVVYPQQPDTEYLKLFIPNREFARTKDIYSFVHNKFCDIHQVFGLKKNAAWMVCGKGYLITDFKAAESLVDGELLSFTDVDCVELVRSNSSVPSDYLEDPIQHIVDTEEQRQLGNNTETDVLVSREFLMAALAKLEDDWDRMESEWGPTPCGLDGAIARGEEPVIQHLRELLKKE